MIQERLHILPLNDVYTHIEAEQCTCQPTVKIEYGLVMIIHNSFDGREGLEMAQEHLDRTYTDEITDFNNAWDDFVRALCEPFNKLSSWMNKKFRIC